MFEDEDHDDAVTVAAAAVAAALADRAECCMSSRVGSILYI